MRWRWFDIIQKARNCWRCIRRARWEWVPVTRSGRGSRWVAMSAFWQPLSLSDSKLFKWILSAASHSVCFSCIGDAILLLLLCVCAKSEGSSSSSLGSMTWWWAVLWLELPWHRYTELGHDCDPGYKSLTYLLPTYYLRYLPTYLRLWGQEKKLYLSSRSSRSIIAHIH